MSSLLSIRGLTKRFGGVEAVSNCTMTLESQKIYGLIGPNGSGKSTLFSCIAGLLHPDEGEISFKNQKIQGLKPHRVRRLGVGMSFQLSRVFPELTVLENLVVASQGGKLQEAVDRGCELLTMIGIPQMRDENASSLSYGQQKLLEFARVLVTNPELVLLDEPAAGVNPTLLLRLYEHIRSLRDKGRTVLIVEHNMDLIMSLCDWLFVLDHGVKIAEGKPEDVRKNEQVIGAYFGKSRAA